MIIYNSYSGMWGNIALETITQVNFGIGFSNMKSDVLIHLAQ
jgi:hypothetical protein